MWQICSLWISVCVKYGCLDNVLVYLSSVLMVSLFPWGSGGNRCSQEMTGVLRLPGVCTSPQRHKTEIRWPEQRIRSVSEERHGNPWILLFAKLERFFSFGENTKGAKKSRNTEIETPLESQWCKMYLSCFALCLHSSHVSACLCIDHWTHKTLAMFASQRCCVLL